MLIWRRKKKEKQGGRKEGKGRKERQKETQGDFKMNDSKPSRSLQCVKGNIVTELERVLQEATAHWHRPGNLTLNVLISTQVSITSQTVSEFPKEFCTSALWPRWIQGRGGELPASSVINVSSSHQSCLENRPKTQREEGYCSQSYFFFLCTGSPYSWGNAFRAGVETVPKRTLPGQQAGGRTQRWVAPAVLARAASDGWLPCVWKGSANINKTRSHWCLRWDQRGHPAGSQIFISAYDLSHQVWSFVTRRYYGHW